jgi:DNA-binding MarR family transcriptional regulator
MNQGSTLDERQRELMQEIGGLNRVIHEPARLMILTMLCAVDEADFLYLQRETGLSKGNLSAHLSRLEEAGLISIEKAFHGKRPVTSIRLTVAGRQAFETYRQQLGTALKGLQEASA